MFLWGRDVARYVSTKANKKNPAASNCRIFFCLHGFDVFVSSEPLGDVFHAAVGQAFHHVLVGGRAVQRPKLGDVTPQLDVVEMIGRDVLRQVVLARIPSHFDPKVLFHLVGQSCHRLRFVVAAHETHAGDARLVLLHKTVQFIVVQRLTFVFPQILAVATWALVGQLEILMASVTSSGTS